MNILVWRNTKKKPIVIQKSGFYFIEKNFKRIPVIVGKQAAKEFYNLNKGE